MVRAEPLDEGERGQWKSWLKTQCSKNEGHGIRSHDFVANRWETMEKVTDFIFLGSKITPDGDCSHEIKNCLLLGRKAMTNLDSVSKSRDITLPTKVRLVKAMVFPVDMYGCGNWTIKKAEHWKIDSFELWCRRRLLRVPWTARTSNQSILKEISPEYSFHFHALEKEMATHSNILAWRIPGTAEPVAAVYGVAQSQTWLKWLSSSSIHWKDWCWSWNSNTLATWCEELIHWKRPWCWESWRQEEKGVTEEKMVGWYHWLNGLEFEQAPGVGNGQGSLVCCSPSDCKELDMTEWLNNNWYYI